MSDKKRKSTEKPTTTTTTTSTTTTSPTNNGQQPRVMETRVRKKAREALDLISGTKQRQESLYNLLGKDYTGPTQQQLEMIFRLFDTNRDGKIGPEELASVLRSMGKRPLTRRIDKILNQCDKNKNGYIEMDEFVEYMQNKAMEKAKILGLIQESESEQSDVEGGDTDEETDSTPKKKAGAAIKKKASKKAAASKKTTTTTTTAASKTVAKQPSFFAPLKKNSSIVQFYNPYAGTHNVANVEVDQFNNPKGATYDLGVEGAFTDFTILFGLFYDMAIKCENDLKAKGFKVIKVKTQKEFLENLPNVDVACIVSGKVADETTTEAEFVEGVKKYHESGKGLFMLGDNEPWIFHINWILSSLFGKSKILGNEYGAKDLTLGDGKTKQTFASHLITSGIVTLYEGITISHMENVPESFDVLASSSAQGLPAVVVSNSKLPANCGRVIVDTGFTKLMDQYYSAGVERYIKNSCVWLLSLDHRFKVGVEHQGNIEKPKEVPMWQYFHGSWHNYDMDASKIVEEAYQDWLKNPYVDVRSVKSGHWQYQIDFKQNKQTNIEHSAHTQRDVKRILVPSVQKLI